MRSAAMLCGGFLAHVIIKVIYLLISLMAIVTTIITRTAREWRTFNSPARHISSGDIISLFITPKGRARPGDGPSGVSECVIRLCGKVHSLWRAHSHTQQCLDNKDKAREIKRTKRRIFTGAGIIIMKMLRARLIDGFPK